MLPLRAEARLRLPPLLEIPRRRHGRSLARARSPAPMDKRRVDHHAAEPSLPHGEREIAIIAVEEAVVFVEAADRLEEGAAQAEADPVHRRSSDLGATLEAVHDGASHVTPVASQAPGP